jgi:hypothetical protein
VPSSTFLFWLGTRRPDSLAALGAALLAGAAFSLYWAMTRHVLAAADPFVVASSERRRLRGMSGAELKRLANQNTPTRVIGLKMGRSLGAVSSQAGRPGTSLKPTNQSSYGTKGKKKQSATVVVLGGTAR